MTYEKFRELVRQMQSEYKKSEEGSNRPHRLDAWDNYKRLSALVDAALAEQPPAEAADGWQIVPPCGEARQHSHNRWLVLNECGAVWGSGKTEEECQQIIRELCEKKQKTPQSSSALGNLPGEGETS